MRLLLAACGLALVGAAPVSITHDAHDKAVLAPQHIADAPNVVSAQYIHPHPGMDVSAHFCVQIQTGSCNDCDGKINMKVQNYDGSGRQTTVISHTSTFSRNSYVFNGCWNEAKKVFVRGPSYNACASRQPHPRPSPADTRCAARPLLQYSRPPSAPRSP